MPRNVSIRNVCATAILLGTAPTASPQVGGHGRSLDTAVVIASEAGSLGGITSEGEWLRQHYPGWRRTRQALVGRNGLRYDRIELESPSGERVTIYFDITAAFGLR